jgi:peptidyl-prolyl cis-trans isomerase SurA
MMNDRLRRWLLAALASLPIALAHGEYREVDRILAIVDDDVVLASEVVSRVNAIRAQILDSGRRPPSNELLMSQVLQRLILESIQLQMAERGGLRITDQNLTDAISNIARRNGMNMDQFRQALGADGISYEEFREEVRRDIILNELQRNQVERRIYISDQELENYLASPVGQLATQDEYRVAHILIAVDERADENVNARAKAAADQVYQELVSGADFCQMAVEHSAGQRALECGDLGWRKPGQLPSLFADRVMKLEVGETLPPIRSAAGFHIVQLREKRGAGTEIRMQTHARHILIKPTEIRSPEECEELVRDIARRLDEGVSFEVLAQRYSDDPGSALAGGDLGWSTPDAFVPEFARVMDATAIGEASAPFETQFGWHILEVLERREQDMSDEYRRAVAMQNLRNRRYDEELQAWLRMIRDEAFVECRIGEPDAC